MQAIQRGKQPMPPRLMVYGTEGIGKSTLAANAPKPVFVQTEDGLNEIACEKFPLSASVDDVLAALAELGAEQHDYQTVVVDSLDWLERLIWDAVCREFRVSSIEKADGGYLCNRPSDCRLRRGNPLTLCGLHPAPARAERRPCDGRRKGSIGSTGEAPLAAGVEGGRGESDHQRTVDGGGACESLRCLHILRVQVGAYLPIPR
jgi:hypothetical protein